MFAFKKLENQDPTWDLNVPLFNLNQVLRHSCSSHSCSFLWLKSDSSPSLNKCLVPALAAYDQRGEWVLGWAKPWDTGTGTDQHSLWRDDTGQDGGMWGWKWEDWVAEGGHRVRGWGVCVQGSLALNLFHMTHTHMAFVWTLSFCLSDCLPTSFSLSLGCAMKEKRWGWWRRVEVDISRHNRSFVMTGARPCHTPGTLVALLITQRGLH